MPFRDTLSDGTRTEYFYIGSPDGEVVSLSLEGESADRYSLRLDSQYGQSDRGFTVIAIRYIANGPLETSTTDLVINLSEGDKRRVVLLPPGHMTATGKNIGGISSEYSSTLTFRLDLTQVSVSLLFVCLLARGMASLSCFSQFQ